MTKEEREKAVGLAKRGPLAYPFTQNQINELCEYVHALVADVEDAETIAAQRQEYAQQIDTLAT